MSGAPPTAAYAVFAGHLPQAVRYHELLASVAVERGLIGPREIDRLWERHLLNCAVVADLMEPGARVVDVGSGAGLPGVALALARPDLQITLLEPLARRADFLREVVDLLELSAVTVLRGRAEDPSVVRSAGNADIVTARAVSALDTLAGWCLPLLRPGGRLLAIKGASAAAEIERTRAAVQRWGAESVALLHCGVGVLTEPTTVVDVVRGAERIERRAAISRTGQHRSRR